MTTSEVEIVRELFTARERGMEPLDAMQQYLDPDVEWLDAVVTNTTLRGHRGFVEAMANLERDGYEVTSSPEDYDALDGGAVLARGHTRLTTGSSFTDLPAYWAFELRDGKIVRGGSATRRDQALAAIGRAD